MQFSMTASPSITFTNLSVPIDTLPYSDEENPNSHFYNLRDGLYFLRSGLPVAGIGPEA